MLNCIYVGIGGFIGAVLRYLISLVPITRGSFPVNTFITNIIGAVIIGIIIARTGRSDTLSPEKVLILKTGLCGGLTTFSTFSAETWSLLQSGNMVLGGAYIVGSVVLCVIGVGIGMWIGMKL